MNTTRTCATSDPRRRRSTTVRRTERLEPRTLLAVVVSIGNTSVTEGDAGLTDAVFEVTLSEPAAADVTVRYRTNDGTATSPPGGPSLLTNGGFEQPAISAGWIAYGAGSNLGGWVVGGEGVDLVTSWQDIEGNQKIDLNAGAEGWVGQTVATVPGTTYLLRFAMAANHETTPPNLKEMEVSFGGEQVAIESFDSTGYTPENMGWVYRTHAVTAASDSTELRFTSLTSSSFGGVVIDDVSLTPLRDYVPEPAGQVTIPAGQTRATVRVPVVGDEVNEPDERFTVTLLEATGGASIGTPSVGTGTILTDDDPPVISIRDAAVDEGHLGSREMTFEVRVRHPHGEPVTLDYAVSNDTATRGSDYEAANGTLTIPAFAAAGTITVTVLGDTVYEDDERLTVTLSNPSAGTLSYAAATGTIRNDDPRPAVSVGDALVAEGNAGTTAARFTVTLSSVIDRPVTVKYFTFNGTAGAGSDYVAAGGTLTIPANESSAAVDVAVLGDAVAEVNETFTLVLAEPVNADLGDAQGTGTIVNDDVPATSPLVSVADVAVVEGDEGTVPALFVVTLSEPAVVPVTVQYTTHAGSAQFGYDFQTTGNTLTFEPGETSKAITVNVVGDRLNEPNEMFVLRLLDPTNAALDDAEAVGTIIADDDRAPTTDVVNVSPNPRFAPVDSLTIVFSERVSGFQVSDLTLTKDRGPNLLTGQQTLTTADGGLTWTLDNLAGITAAGGSYSLFFAGGQASGVLDAGGNFAGAASENWVVQVPPAPAPAVAAVFVSAPHWTQSFKDFLQSTGAGDATFGYAVPSGAAQLGTLPWAGLDRVSIRFTRDVIATEGDLRVAGVNLRGYPVTGYDYDDSTFTATWTFAPAPVADKLMLALESGPAGIIDAATGLYLDGEWTNASTGSFPSGNGAAGGNFAFRVNVLSGDAVRGGGVNVIDAVQIRRRRMFSAANPGGGGYTPFLDVTGDGLLNDADVLVVRRNMGRNLPNAEPQAPPFFVQAASSSGRRGWSPPTRSLFTENSILA